MKCVILQPCYLPWRGYFDQIRKADVFVFYDDVQYDARGWRNRNRVLGPAGPQWITIPVHHHGSQTERRPIHTIEICWDTDWPRKHIRTLECCYGRAPCFDDIWTWLAPFYQRRDRYLADLTIDLTMAVARWMSLESTRFLRSSQVHGEGSGTARLLSILQQVGATHYISGPSARAYLDEALLNRNGITVEYMSYDYPPYRQMRAGFEPNLSIVDLLFMAGPDAARSVSGAAQEMQSTSGTGQAHRGSGIV
jgi:hypothetical protein